MNAQDFRSLQEAYMEVVENQQQLGENMEKSPRNIERTKKKSQERKGRRVRVRYYGHSEVSRAEREGRKLTPTQSEKFDLYDTILSHLLDEGYAETPEAAEAIMVNMSEDWRESICEEVLDEGWKTELAKKALKKVGKEVRKSDAYKKVKRFAVSTALGAIGVPLVS